MEVEADGGQDGVDAVSRAVMQVIAAHAVLVFDMADNRFDRCPAFHLAFHRRGDAVLLPCDPDLELVLVTMPLVALTRAGMEYPAARILKRHSFLTLLSNR